MALTERGRWASSLLDERGRLVTGSLTETGQFVIGAAAPPTSTPLDLGTATIAGASSITATLSTQTGTVPLNLGPVTIAGTSAITATLVVKVPLSASITGVSSIAATLSAQTPPVAVIISDLFNRADSTTTLGVADTGQAWTALRGNWGISASQAYTPNNVDAVAVIDAGVTDATVQMTLPVANSSHYVVFRCQDADNFLAIMMPSGNGNYFLYKREAGVYTSLAQATGGSAAGDTITVELVGSSITLKRAGVTLLTATSTLFPTATKYGMSTGSNTRRFDSFSVSTTSTTNPLNLGPVTVAGVSSISASPIVRVGLSAAISATSSLSAGLVAMTPLAPVAQISGLSSITAALSTVGTLNPVALAATITATSTMAADPIIRRGLSAQIAGQSTIAATIAAKLGLSAQINGLSAITATLAVVGSNIPVALSATITATSGLTADPVVRRGLAAQISGTSGITASLAAKLGLSASFTGASTITATAVVLTPLSAAITAQGGIDAALAARVALAGTIAGTSAITAALSVVGTLNPVALSAVIAATSGLAAELVVRRGLTAQVTATATMTATLAVFGPGDVKLYHLRITRLPPRLQVRELPEKWVVRAVTLYSNYRVTETRELSIQFTPRQGVTLPTTGVTATWRLVQDDTPLSNGPAVVTYGTSAITITAVVAFEVRARCQLEYTVGGLGNEILKPFLDLDVRP